MKFKIDKQFIITLLQLPKAKRETVLKLLQNIDRDINSLADLIEYVANCSDIQWMSFLSIGDFNSALKKARKILQDSTANNIKMVSILDENYPELLRTIEYPPILLNYIGNIDLLTEKRGITLVGTRKPSGFSYRYAEYVGSFFAQKGFNIISGFSNGCNTAAHLGAMDANGTTSAIVSYGLDKLYSKKNKHIFEQIKTNGVLISEYFVGTTSNKQRSIEKNRLEAALSVCVFLIEATVNSNSMRTAKYAVQYGRLLVCMKPPLRYFRDTRVSGNQILSRTEKAVTVFDDQELNELCNHLKKL